MFKDLPALQKIVRQLQKVPYLASKNIYRIALYFLRSRDEDVSVLFNAILDAKKQIKTCSVCMNLTERGPMCAICSSSDRDQAEICVVETLYDLHAIERAGGYNGVYHVLGGSLCPLEGIGPDDLNIDSLTNRITHTTREIIFATNSTPEGEATASFISSRLEDLEFDLKISRLASGVPIGSSLEYMDR